MKAWLYEGDDGSTIVFAETRNKAKAYLVNSDICEGIEYKDIFVRRAKEADCLYKGRNEISWDDDNDRLWLVKNYGWSCIDVNVDFCKTCVARNDCPKYEDA